MKRIFLGIISLLICGTAFAEFNPLSIPDSFDVRKAVEERWFYPDLDVIRENKTEIRTNSLGEKFQIRLEETDSTFAVIVAPEIMMDVVVYTEKGSENTISAEYPFDASGSWVLIRNSQTGKVDKLKMYFGANSDVYVQFYQEGKKTFADFITAGYYTNRGVPLGIPFENLYTMQFRDIYALTKNSLNWKYVDVNPGLYGDKKQMIGVLKKMRNKIVYADDACYDEYGNPAFISTGLERIVDGEDKSKGNISLSSAGFLKWVVDGLVEPVNGAGTYIQPLLRSTLEFDSMTYNQQLVVQKKIPVNFSLDWTRNLAAARLSVMTRKKYLYEDSGVDVTIQPFSAELTEQGPKQVVTYIQNCGYQIDKLKSILYILAVTEPNYGYLAAIRRTVPAKGNQLEYHIFDQCAVIFPYFDKNGRFCCSVFENGQEYSLAQFASRYKGSFIHMTRFSCSSKFAPMGYDVPVEDEGREF